MKRVLIVDEQNDTVAEFQEQADGLWHNVDAPDEPYPVKDLLGEIEAVLT